MSDLLNPEVERDNTIVLSDNLDPCDMLDGVQVTLAKFEVVSPSVTLYRFVDGEEVTSFELTGFELGKLVKVFTGKRACSDVAAILERSRGRLQQTSVCPELVASDVLVELLTVLSQSYLSEAQQSQVQTVIDGASTLIVQASRKKSA